jgi:hypothetical protein
MSRGQSLYRRTQVIDDAKNQLVATDGFIISVQFLQLLSITLHQFEVLLTLNPADLISLHILLPRIDLLDLSRSNIFLIIIVDILDSHRSSKFA